MLVSKPQSITLPQIASLAAIAHNRIAQIYLHWTAGRYGQIYSDYHLNIDADGTIYRTCTSLTQCKSHTWHRNSGQHRHRTVLRFGGAGQQWLRC